LGKGRCSRVGCCGLGRRRGAERACERRGRPACSQRKPCPTPTPRPSFPAQVLLGLAHSLAHLHALGLLHGDVKPDNVLLKSDVARPLGFATKVGGWVGRWAREGQEGNWLMPAGPCCSGREREKMGATPSCLCSRSRACAAAMASPTPLDACQPPCPQLSDFGLSRILRGGLGPAINVNGAGERRQPLEGAGWCVKISRGVMCVCVGGCATPVQASCHVYERAHDARCHLWQRLALSHPSRSPGFDCLTPSTARRPCPRHRDTPGPRDVPEGWVTASKQLARSAARPGRARAACIAAPHLCASGDRQAAPHARP
jgi:serine/threonine protein kinase